MKRRDSLLVILNHCSDRPEFGRTSLQKVAFFADVAIGLDLSHRAHYYGPFSDTVEEEVEALVLSGLVEEKVQNLGFVGASGFQGRRYEYTVTDEGHDRIEALRSAHEDEVRRLEVFLDDLVESAGSLDQQLLSAAAKTYYIANEQDQPVSVDEIRQLAGDLGWDLTTSDISRVVEVLRDLGLVT